MITPRNLTLEAQVKCVLADHITDKSGSTDADSAVIFVPTQDIIVQRVLYLCTEDLATAAGVLTIGTIADPNYYLTDGAVPVTANANDVGVASDTPFRVPALTPIVDGHTSATGAGTWRTLIEYVVDYTSNALPKRPTT
jgi:hypothetical protein